MVTADGNPMEPEEIAKHNANPDLFNSNSMVNLQVGSLRNNRLPSKTSIRGGSKSKSPGRVLKN
jgi:hypothetical protein